jgi:integrase
MLGHSSIAITLDIYSHVLPTMQENAVRVLEDTLK